MNSASQGNLSVSSTAMIREKTRFTKWNTAFPAAEGGLDLVATARSPLESVAHSADFLPSLKTYKLMI